MSTRNDRSLRWGGLHRRSTVAQTHIYYCVAACGVCLLIIFVGIFTPLVLFQDLDNDYSTTIARVERNMAFDAAQRLSSSIMTGYAVTQALEGYVMSRMKILPNMSLPPEERVKGQDFTGFTDLARLLFTDTTDITSSMLMPGGIYTHMYPVPNNTFMKDVFEPDNYAQTFLPTPQQSVLDGNVAYIGPFFSTVDFMRGYWGLAVRRPVFNRTNYTRAGWDTFWGFTQTLLNISAILEEQPFAVSQLRQQRKYRNVDYVITVRDSKTRKLMVLQSSRARWTQPELEEFVKTGSSMDVTPNHPFTVTVRGRDYGKWLSGNNITVVVATVLAGSLLSLAIFTALLLYCTQTYDGTAHAPKLAPFAMLTVGPCRGEELWELAPDEMVDVTDRLGRVLARQMERHHAYQIQQVHPLTTSYVTRSVAAAVQMAFDAIEELHRRPIDEPLRRLLGDDGRLLLSYAVHWCNDAVVRLDPMEGGYRYEGPDVVYGGRMWAFAAPNVVTASEAVAQALPRFGLRCVTAEHHRRVNVVRSRSVCGATGDGEMNGAGHSTNNTSSSSSGGAATIYVPFPAPTTVEAAAGMGRGCCGGGGGGAAPYRPAVAARDDKDVPLPPQTLLTLVDTRRPVLLAARAAAPTPHPQQQQHHRRSDDFPAPANTPAAIPVHELVTGPINVAVRGAENGNPLTIVRSGGSVHSSEDGGSAAALPAPLPLTVESDTSQPHHTSGNLLRSSFVIQGDGVTRALLRPVIPHALDVALDVALHVAFDYQAITLGMSYDAVRVLVYYFYSSYKILFRPLAAPERHNIYRRLVTAFGVPQQGILEHLAARCAIRCLQQSTKLRQLAMQQRQSERGTTLVEDESPLPGVAVHARGRAP